MRSHNAVVIGGGIIGTACAHYLADKGLDVTIIDKGQHGQGCSHANCGLISKSHVLPLNEPGAVAKTLKYFFWKNPPFRVGRRFDPLLWNWLVNFALRCSHDKMMEGARALSAMLESTVVEYERLRADHVIDCEWQPNGCMYVYRTPKHFEDFGKVNQFLTEEFGIGATPYTGSDLQRLEPALRSDVAGAWLYDVDSFVRPDKMLSSWRQSLENRGVRVVENCQFRGFYSEADQALAVISSQGDFRADHVVMATGVWTPGLGQHLGVTLPIQPGKGYSMTMAKPKICPKISMLFQEDRVACTPMQSAYRLGSMMEFNGFDSSNPPSRYDVLRRGAEKYLVEPYTDEIQEHWYGFRPMAYDGRPFIDRAPALSNVWIAAGHSMLGLTLAPVTGKLVAELVSGDTPHLDPRPFGLAHRIGMAHCRAYTYPTEKTQRHLVGT